MSDKPLVLETFEWGGQKRFRCPGVWERGNKCEFDSYDPVIVVDHYSSVHVTSSDRSGAPGPLLFDANDKPINREARSRVIVPQE